MAFVKMPPKAEAPDSPDGLFRDLPRRKIPDVLPHQKSMMQNYSATAVNAKDVALQLPTGSGKTLVGLLIAEWRRRKFKEKVVYLCPNKQLVHQAVAQAEEKYGLSVVGFTGSKHEYSTQDETKYKLRENIAITTYSSLFNTKPYFDDADVIIVDDAHAAENYVTELWSLRVERFNEKHNAVHSALSTLLKSYLDPLSYTRLTGQWDSPTDKSWVDKLPTPVLDQLHDEICEVLDTHTKNSDLKYAWSLLRHNLRGCHFYMSSTEILIRPLIAPTWTHQAFHSAKQRIYMSATLGEGGDLERLLGRNNIQRLPIPEGWDTQGVGRRFFIFPTLSLNATDSVELRRKLLKQSSRSLVLVPSEQMKAEVVKDIEDNLSLTTFTADDIEHSKSQFVNTNSAVAVVANRYDGIDFPGDECRLLFIEGLPKSVNSQERFLMSRMGANVLFNERIQTRVLQAIGRCTRSLNDFSAVIVTGEELPDYLVDPRRREYFHPELQAELEFGVEQSKNSTIQEFEDNLSIFLENGKEWEDANQMIVDCRQSSTQKTFPSIQQLKDCVKHEVKYQAAMWQQDYVEALSQAETILGLMTDGSLYGYRALWEYLAGSAAYLAGENNPELLKKSQLHFSRAKNAAKDIPWLVHVSKHAQQQTAEQKEQEDKDRITMLQVEKIEAMLESLGTAHDRNFAEHERKIFEGFNHSESFEEAHKLLGVHLGYDAGKVEISGSPDPWWQCGEFCIVFEDHANAQDASSLSITKARQVSSHPTWMRENVSSCQSEAVNILPVLLTPVMTVYPGALTHLSNVYLWKLSDFKEWTAKALSTIRELRKSFVEPGDLAWRAQASSKLQNESLDFLSLIECLKKQPARNVLSEK
ncbi:DEAD/DEAH box helicase family protein [Vibrio parahaemolyticus]|nr:DEAD/DEAH box helicase family protein [Vibrio parahaemolyticus]MBM5091349.1 DEAD/DEAH box helicase family protein [Vibrio parahaemolyticus]MBM5183653.1 DEAD/DEAH box helicase family protein [Vibrio parahaemolyticus]